MNANDNFWILKLDEFIFQNKTDTFLKILLHQRKNSVPWGEKKRKVGQVSEIGISSLSR